MHVILLTKDVWAAAKDANVAEKVRTVSIIERKSRVDMEICCGGGADVLGPTDAMDGAIWGSSVSSTGWSAAISPAMS